MPLVAAKCTNCNGELQIDNTKDAAVCPYCGSAFIVEKAINNYNMINNYKADVINIVNNNSESADVLYKTCLECCKRGAFSDMVPTHKKFHQNYPTDYRVYYIRLLYWTKNFTLCDDNNINTNNSYKKRAEEIYNDIKRWAPAEELIRITEEYNIYIKKLNKLNDEINEKLKLKDIELANEKKKEIVLKALLIGIVIIIAVFLIVICCSCVEKNYALWIFYILIFGFPAFKIIDYIYCK